MMDAGVKDDGMAVVVPDSRRPEETLVAVCNMMRGLVDASIRDGMLRAVPDPLEARQLSDLHARLLHRIRAIEVALHEFHGDLRRANQLFERAERRTQQLPIFDEEIEPIRY